MNKKEFLNYKPSTSTMAWCEVELMYCRPDVLGQR